MAVRLRLAAAALLLAAAASAASASADGVLAPEADLTCSSKNSSAPAYAPPPSPPPRRVMGLIPSEMRTRDDGSRCIDFSARARSPHWPAYRSAHVLQGLPLAGFTADVRARLVAVGEAVAAANGGWRTDRHENYPTTDFSLKEDLPPRYAQGVFALAKQWVLPHMADLAGVFASDLRLHDLFLVKYEVKADGSSQQHLAPHTDGSTWTFSMGLNDPGEYEGGGCKFHEHDIGVVHSSPTTTLVHYGQLRHEGLKITRGKRYLLVGFVYHADDCEYAHGA